MHCHPWMPNAKFPWSRPGDWLTGITVEAKSMQTSIFLGRRAHELLAGGGLTHGGGPMRTVCPCHTPSESTLKVAVNNHASHISRIAGHASGSATNAPSWRPRAAPALPPKRPEIHKKNERHEKGTPGILARKAHEQIPNIRQIRDMTINHACPTWLFFWFPLWLFVLVDPRLLLLLQHVRRWAQHACGTWNGRMAPNLNTLPVSLHCMLPHNTSHGRQAHTFRKSHC